MIFDSFLDVHLLKTHNAKLSKSMQKREWKYVSENTTVLCVIFIMLTTCFSPYAGPSSGHKIHKDEKLYSVSHKI
jgi:hypothetical protein